MNALSQGQAEISLKVTLSVCFKAKKYAGEFEK
jgi:hypothetical protein